MDALASWIAGRARAVVVVSVLVALAAGAGAAGVTKAVVGAGFEDPGSESSLGRKALERATGADPAPGVIAVVRTEASIPSRAARTRIAAVVASIRGDRDVRGVTSILDRPSAALISRDRHRTFVAVYLRPLSDAAAGDAARRIERRLDGVPGVTAGGPALLQRQVEDQIAKDLRIGEIVAFPLLLILSLVVFRGVVAAMLPLAVGGFAVVGTLALLRLIAEALPLSVFALNVVSGLGLGLGIDYSLFVVSRYREELARHGPGLPALRRTLASAGRTVVFSGLTVSLAVLSLLVFPQRFLYSMAIGGALVTLLAMLAALVFLPALLALLGERVNALAPARLQRSAATASRPAAAGGWYRLAHGVMRRPGPIAALCTLALLALGAPALRTHFAGFDGRILPPGQSARAADHTLLTQFPAGAASPVVLAIEAPRGAGRALDAYGRSLGRLGDVAAVGRPVAVGAGTWRLDVASRQGPLTRETRQLMERIRSLPHPYPTRVTGRTADLHDRNASMTSHLAFALPILAATTLIMLFSMTGSVLLPLKSLVMNLLTVCATLGLLVLVFQDGRLESVLDFHSIGSLEQAAMILLGVIAFGLSTDYGVFLLARIKEARDSGAPDREAIAVGLERTGRIVTAAALLFCVAMVAIAASHIAFIKSIGVGAALAVLIDATLVRALLVPALMALLGERNWWAPRGLRRLHARARPDAPARALSGP